MKKWGCFLGLLGIFHSVSSWADNPVWSRNLIDPHPMQEDFTLSMPCGGAMVFRKVEVPTEGGVLDDISIQLGQENTEQGYNEYIHKAQLAAPFSGEGKKPRFYYIGKYDVTRNQYDAVMQQKNCVNPDQQGQKPINNVSWFDAQDFSRKWTIWLLQSHKGSLPKRGEQYAFVRLPTEAEWYYAAQGGNKVSETEFLASTWPMPEGIEQYVMAGSELANGQVQQVGSMKPNPLGLYDMLGEVGQMMQDNYHLNRVGRLQGQAGGMIVKGGNYTYNPSDLTSALREEIPFYDQHTNQPTHLATVGFRVVLASTALGNLQETTQAETEFNTLLDQSQNMSLNTHQLLKKLESQTTDAAIKAGLEHIETQMTTDARSRNDAMAEMVRAQIEAATSLGMNIWEHDHTITLLEKELSLLTMLSDKQKSEIKTNIINHRQILQNSMDSYLDLIRRIHDVSVSIHKDKQFEMVIAQYKARNLNNLAFFTAQIQTMLNLPATQWTNEYILRQMHSITVSQARNRQ